MNTNSKIKCEIVQDLLPSYVDGLVSDGTAAAVEEHIRECDACRHMLESMKSDEGIPQEQDERDRKEIDFLRKSRKKSKRAIALGVLLTLLLAAAVLGAKQYLIGSEYNGDMGCDISVNGSTMNVGVTAADSIHVIRGMDFTMEDGVARGTAKAVLPGVIHSSGTYSDVSDDDSDESFQVVTCEWAGTFSFDEDIREVWIGDRIYWADGVDVSAKASDVFRMGHDYVGDAPANGALLDALHITEDLGSLYSELETEGEPYIWTIILDNDQTKYNPEYLENHLQGYAYILLGMVGNLNEVDFRYTADGKTKVLKVTEEDADEFFGRSIKTCRGEPGALSELMEMTDLN